MSRVWLKLRRGPVSDVHRRELVVFQVVWCTSLPFYIYPTLDFGPDDNAACVF
jgi:hypothetical protein